MKVFTFDPLTREYTGEEDAFVEPVNGMDLCSPNGTFLAPLADVPPGNSQIFQGGEWRLVPDHRGKRALDISSKRFYTISQLGSLPTGHVTVDEDMERDYLDHPDHYILTNTSFSKRSEEEVAAIEVGTAKRRKRSERDAMLSSTDWKVFRKEDAIRLGISADGAADTINLLALYRQYLRDFTKQEGWWDTPILSLEEFENNEKELS
jgi:hypothetical protein